MTERTLDSHRAHRAIRVCERRHADDGIELEERYRRGRIVKVDCAPRDLLLQCLRQGVGIDFKTHRQCGLRRDTRSDSAVLLAGNGFVQLKRIAPKSFAAERVVPEGLATFVQQRLRMVHNFGVEAFAGGSWNSVPRFYARRGSHAYDAQSYDCCAYCDPRLHRDLSLPVSVPARLFRDAALVYGHRQRLMLRVRARFPSLRGKATGPPS